MSHIRIVRVHPLFRNTSQIEEVNSEDEEPAQVRSGKKKHSASEIMDILREADEEAKDSIIQEFFMKEDF